jgi:hypothetical protein
MHEAAMEGGITYLVRLRISATLVRSRLPIIIVRVNLANILQNRLVREIGGELIQYVLSVGLGGICGKITIYLCQFSKAPLFKV